MQVKLGRLKIEVQSLRAFVPRQWGDITERAQLTDRPPMEYPADVSADTLVETLFLDDMSAYLVPSLQDSVQIVITGHEGIRLSYQNTRHRARKVKRNTVRAAQATAAGARKSYRWSQEQRARIERARQAYRVVPEDSETSKSSSDAYPSHDQGIEIRPLSESDHRLQFAAPQFPWEPFDA